jgi:thiol-disulfide isomerase/thioredoxin
VKIGQKYTDFGLATPEGGVLNISDVHDGNVLLIDFWASWCGPCRRANPELVEIYHEYHDRGLEILGVSLDRDSASWVKAIADDQLGWNHISDLKYWDSEGAELYGVSAIPHSVLIDRNGIIAAKKLEGQELRDAIESLL